MEVISFARIDARRLGQKTLDVQEIECGNAEEAHFSLALPGRQTNRSKSGVAHGGSVALSQSEGKRDRCRPSFLTLAERRLHQGEQHISQQETVIT
ncbi:hypothetical protein IVB27_28055 [Bradyrhizobium sp. 197]|uniref:hypothetical protein n=1 Tax=unclassified Bradyrhizobium TaxID=2631580 RepID=UPI001FFBD328|nr:MULTISPECIES: hypothetical protein [unclassified Bradyrhizobium]MCK1478495.1 hypothetical protein [Bradyrhizobium sp. 197]UPJ60112.1 hypothetical protein IVB24_10970 [Bradyrhizobium sp. 192]